MNIETFSNDEPTPDQEITHKIASRQLIGHHQFPNMARLAFNFISSSEDKIRFGEVCDQTSSQQLYLAKANQVDVNLTMKLWVGQKAGDPLNLLRSTLAIYHLTPDEYLLTFGARGKWIRHYYGIDSKEDDHIDGVTRIQYVDLILPTSNCDSPGKEITQREFEWLETVFDHHFATYNLKS